MVRRSGARLVPHTVWLLEDKQAEWDAWVARADGDAARPRPDRHVRRAAITSTPRVYGFRGEHVPTSARLGTATALDHPFAGVIAIAADAYDSGGLSVVREIAGPEIPVVAVFVPERTHPDAAPNRRRSTSCSVSRPAIRSRPGTRASLPRCRGSPRVGFAGPFVRTIPGTDTYTDDL